VNREVWIVCAYDHRPGKEREGMGIMGESEEICVM
jgi:hypothetical protein